jgi:hypothetical protein
MTAPQIPRGWVDRALKSKPVKARNKGTELSASHCGSKLFAEGLFAFSNGFSRRALAGLECRTPLLFFASVEPILFLLPNSVRIALENRNLLPDPMVRNQATPGKLQLRCPRRVGVSLFRYPICALRGLPTGSEATRQHYCLRAESALPERRTELKLLAIIKLLLKRLQSLYQTRRSGI